MDSEKTIEELIEEKRLEMQRFLNSKEGRKRSLKVVGLELVKFKKRIIGRLKKFL